MKRPSVSKKIFVVQVPTPFDAAASLVDLRIVDDAEIYAGLRPGEEAVTRAFFEARGEVILDAAAGRQAGQFLSRYRSSRGVELADALVAAAAATAELALWTRNRRHYPMASVRFYEPA